MNKFVEMMDKLTEEYQTSPKFKELRIATEDALKMARRIGKGTTEKERKNDNIN